MFISKKNKYSIEKGKGGLFEQYEKLVNKAALCCEVSMGTSILLQADTFSMRKALISEFLRGDVNLLCFQIWQENLELRSDIFSFSRPTAANFYSLTPLAVTLGIFERVVCYSSRHRHSVFCYPNLERDDAVKFGLILQRTKRLDSVSLVLNLYHHNVTKFENITGERQRLTS